MNAHGNGHSLNRNKVTVGKMRRIFWAWFENLILHYADDVTLAKFDTGTLSLYTFPGMCFQ